MSKNNKSRSDYYCTDFSEKSKLFVDNGLNGGRLNSGFQTKAPVFEKSLEPPERERKENQMINLSAVLGGRSEDTILTADIFKLEREFGKGEPENFDDIIKIITDIHISHPKHSIEEVMILVNAIYHEYKKRNVEFFQALCNNTIKKLLDDVRQDRLLQYNKNIGSSALNRALPLIPFYFGSEKRRICFSSGNDFIRLIPVFFEMTLRLLNIQVSGDKYLSHPIDHCDDEYKKLVDSSIKSFVSIRHSRNHQKEKQIDREVNFCLRILKDLSKKPKKDHSFVFAETRKLFQTSLSYSLMKLLEPHEMALVISGQVEKTFSLVE